MQMAAADWSQVQGRKVFASMRKQRRIPISSTKRQGARSSSPLPPSMTMLPQTSSPSADFSPKMVASVAWFVH